MQVKNIYQAKNAKNIAKNHLFFTENPLFFRGVIFRNESFFDGS